MKIRSVISLVLMVMLGAACGQKDEVYRDVNEDGKTDVRVSDTTVKSKLMKANDGTCRLVMGWDPWEPYMYEDVDGNVRGLDIELITVIAEKAGCDISFSKASWTELLERLHNGDVDVVAGASETEARRNFARFSNPYRRESFALYVRNTESSRYPSTLMSDLLEMGMRVGVVSDYVYGEQITELQAMEKYKEQFIEVPIGELNYLSLLDYEIDGFLEDPFVAATVLRNKGLDQDIERHPLVIDSGGVRFMFSKASVSEETVKRINKGMSELIAEEVYQATLDKYSH